MNTIVPPVADTPVAGRRQRLRLRALVRRFARGRSGVAAVEFALMVLDSVERVPSEMPLVMVLDKRDTLRAYDPQVRPVLNQPKVKGVPLTIRYGLTVEETRRLAKAKEATGTDPACAEDQASTSLSPCSPRT